MNANKIKTVIQELVRELVELKYQDIYEQDYEKITSAPAIQEAIESYGQVLTMPPNSAFENIDIYETDNPNKIQVDFDLWFNNKKSDLTLSCAVYDDGKKGKYSIENIHML
ncbi:DUF7668 domain-containing protein [Mucilaginibacter psychrotolerans]|uniref:DUF7668 domain-containing protein n=1 Tax=Mucilaginibacter psychrotolerans TaxID=1524096 RepID=A0A4Y8S3U3_9SPHI|nr:hypothetical protein [Mucilaginibacter psychrotolerans]TFF33361.1 hypothetical protein E2R66_26240 [Mucilaginibacter psychrotolerans]